MNPWRAPQRIGVRHLADQPSKLGIDLRAPAEGTRSSGPEPGEASPMPVDDGSRTDDHQGRLQGK